MNSQRIHKAKLYNQNKKKYNKQTWYWFFSIFGKYIVSSLFYSSFYYCKCLLPCLLPFEHPNRKSSRLYINMSIQYILICIYLLYFLVEKRSNNASIHRPRDSHRQMCSIQSRTMFTYIYFQVGDGSYNKLETTGHKFIRVFFFFCLLKIHIVKINKKYK